MYSYEMSVYITILLVALLRASTCGGEDCPYYYECKYDNGTSFPMSNSTCPEGTLLSTVQRDCVHAILEAKTSPTDTSNEAVVIRKAMEGVIRSAPEVCRLIKRIDVYERVTIGSLSLRAAFEPYEKFDSYIEPYNSDLEAAQSRMGVWRKGNDIVLDVMIIYNRAKEYETKFDEMYIVNKDRLTVAPGKSSKLIANLNQNMEELNATIEKKLGDAAAAHPAVRTYIIDDIKNLERKMVEMTEELRESSPLALQLKELVVFLDFAKRLSSRVLELTLNVNQRIYRFYEDVEATNTTFHKYIDEAERELSLLLVVDLQLQEHKQTSLDELAELNKQRNQLEIREATLTTAKEKLLKQREVREVIPKTSNLDCPSPFSFDILYFLYSYFILRNCHYPMQRQQTPNTQSYHTERQHTNNRQNISQINIEIEELQTKIGFINSKITMLKKQSTIDVKIQQTRSEMRQFHTLVSDSRSLAVGASSVLEDLRQLKNKIYAVEIAFRLATVDLEWMIGQAQGAETEAQRNDAKVEILAAASSHRDQIDQSSQKILNVQECLKLG